MSDTQKVVVNKCYGGFGLSDAAYEKLIAWGVPVRAYVDQELDPATGRYKPQPLNEGEVIFDRDLTPPEHDSLSAIYWQYRGKTRMTTRYWDTWTDHSRSHPLLVRLVEELGAAANGPCSNLEVVEIPADVEYEISEYDGMEHIAEAHRTWG